MYINVASDDLYQKITQTHTNLQNRQQYNCIHYKYLGIVPSENGSYKPAITTLANQASKALFMLMCGASKLAFPKLTLLVIIFLACVLLE